MGAQVIAVIGMKFCAQSVGVAGVGEAGVILGGASLLGTVIGFGLATGLMRWGPEQLTSGDQVGWSQLLATAWWLWRCLAIASLPLTAAATTFGWLDPGLTGHGAVLGVPLIAVCLSATILLSAEVNARQLPGRLALIGPANALGQIAGVIPWLLIYGQDAIPLALASGATLGLILTWQVARLARPVRLIPRREPGECERLLRFGGPWMLASLGGAGVQSLLCIQIAHDMGSLSAGWFRAGTTIAIQYMGVLMGVLSQIYAPRIASMRNNSESLTKLVRNQSYVTVNLIGIASISLMVLLDPLIGLLYTEAFLPTHDLAVWCLAGMPLRAMSWCLGYVALATAPGWLLLCGELATGVIWYACACMLMQTSLGLAGAGVAFVVAYLFHNVVISLICLKWARVPTPFAPLVFSVAWTIIIIVCHQIIRQ